MPVEALTGYGFGNLARLLYRDTLKQKHQNRSRLLQELKSGSDKKTKALPSKEKAKAIANTASTPLAEVLLQHVIAVSRQHLEKAEL